MLRFFFFISVWLFSFQALHCHTLPKSNTSGKVHKLTFSKENGTLMVHTEKNKDCLLADDAINYETYVSPDAQWIAVEIQVLSNLQILRLYKKDTNGCYKAPNYTFSTIVWRDFLRNTGVSMDNIIHPRINFLQWKEGNKIEIEISGDTEYKTIHETHSYALRENAAFNESESIDFNRYIDHNESVFFQFVISKADKNIIAASFNDIYYDPSFTNKKGNIYNIKYNDGYTSTIELLKKNIEAIEYLSVNVKIYQNSVLKYTFSSDANEYYDHRYPNCSSRHGDAGFYDGSIQIEYTREMIDNILKVIKKNQWSPFIFAEHGSEKIVDKVFIEKELCRKIHCKIQVKVPKGEEFAAISKINALEHEVCASRISSEAGGAKITPIDMDMQTNARRTSDEIVLEDKSNVDSAIEDMKIANIVFDTPSTMDKHKTYMIQLKLDAKKNIEELLKELHGSEKESAIVKYSNRMEAKLISENKKAFEITAISPTIQAISALSTITWKWDVTPLEYGQQYLHLSLNALIDADGKETAFPVKTFDKRIKVNITIEDETMSFIQSNWKWILGTLLFPLIGFLWSRLRGKKEPKDEEKKEGSKK